MQPYTCDTTKESNTDASYSFVLKLVTKCHHKSMQVGKVHLLVSLFKLDLTGLLSAYFQNGSRLQAVGLSSSDPTRE